MSTVNKGFLHTSDENIIYYEDHNPTGGKPIVLIPGYCCSCRFFDNNFEALSKDHRVISFDPRGQGSSGKGLQGHTISRNCTDIKELLDYLNVEDATMLGWSMAGQYIVKYFDMFGAHRVKALGLIDCPLGAQYDEPWNAHGLKGFNMEVFNDHLKMSYNDWEGFCAFFSGMMYDGVDESLKPWSTAEMTKTPPWIAYAIYSDMTHLNGYELLGKITLPMVFFGCNGRVTANGTELADKWYPEGAKSCPWYEKYPFTKGSHVFFQCCADEFNADVLHFVDSVWSK